MVSQWLGRYQNGLPALDCGNARRISGVTLFFSKCRLVQSPSFRRRSLLRPADTPLVPVLLYT